MAMETGWVFLFPIRAIPRGVPLLRLGVLSQRVSHRWLFWWLFGSHGDPDRQRPTRGARPKTAEALEGPGGDITPAVAAQA